MDSLPQNKLDTISFTEFYKKLCSKIFHTDIKELGEYVTRHGEVKRAAMPIEGHKLVKLYELPVLEIDFDIDSDEHWRTRYSSRTIQPPNSIRIIVCIKCQSNTKDMESLVKIYKKLIKLIDSTINENPQLGIEKNSLKKYKGAKSQKSINSENISRFIRKGAYKDTSSIGFSIFIETNKIITDYINPLDNSRNLMEASGLI